MEAHETIIDLLKEKKIPEATQIFNKTPILDYETSNLIFTLDMFEFSSTKKKNPVFFRVLLNYISLINIILDQDIKPMEFHQILFHFNAKFTYEDLKDRFVKLILMAKSSIEVYNLIFQYKEKAFENIEPDVKSSIDFDFNKNEEESIGYTYQELGKVFLNDYIIGRDKGHELPNILFYIKSTNEIQKLMGKLFIIPPELKIDLNEILNQSGINEFDNIVLLKDDIIINENNPYFRYIKTVKGSNAIYEKLELKKDEIYILEFKHSYKMNTDIVNIQNLGKSYVELYNKNIYDMEESFNFKDYKILYFYNYFEDLGYKNLTNLEIDIDKWKFLYLSPACQIIPVTKLSSEVAKLKKRIDLNEQKIYSLEQDNKLFKEKFKNIEAILAKDKININIEAKKTDEFTINKDLKYKIEEEFNELSKQITKIYDLKKYNKLFIDYEEGIESFINPAEKLEINNNDKKWETEIKGEIQDDITCFQLMAPSIGNNKASKNYFKIQTYLNKKLKKNDEMSEIYQYIYFCFYGRRKLTDKSSPEKYYSNAENIKDLLVNIIKYTFYCDKNRNNKVYYLLAIFKELLSVDDKSIKNSIFELRKKSLYQLVLMTIDLINDKSLMNNFDGYISAPNKIYI